MTSDMRHLLKIPTTRLDAINQVLLDPDTQVIADFFAVVEKYGTPCRNQRQSGAGLDLATLRDRLKDVQPEHLEHLDWLTEQRDQGAFISESRIPEASAWGAR